MAQTTQERTSWVLRVPYHASTDQVLDDTPPVFDLDTLSGRGQFKSNDVVGFFVENLGDVAITTITFKDSPDNITFTAVLDDDHNPAYPLVVEGRVGGRIVLNAKNIKYLQVLAHHTVVGAQGLIRLTLDKISGGHPGDSRLA